MSKRRLPRWLTPLALAGALAAEAPQAQIQYAVGMNVVPVYEGWQQNPDGSFTMIFGYFNRNHEEELHIPVGPNNYFDSGQADRGQPTHFYTRRQPWIFKVVVPKDWGEKRLVWTLTANGQTERANGSLLPVWETDALVLREGRGGRFDPANKPPSISIEGPVERTAAPSHGVPLTVAVADDGLPQPAARRRSSFPSNPRPNLRTQAILKVPAEGVAVTWMHHRGPGTVTFDPMRPSVEAGRAHTVATFSEPGTYVLQAWADDAFFTVSDEVTITVTASNHD